MDKLFQLGCSILVIMAASYPLFDLILAFGEIEHRVSIFTIGLILIWLVLMLLCGILWFYFTWVSITEEKDE